MNLLASQTNEFILSHLKSNYNHDRQNEKMQTKCITESLTYDSGVHSVEDNCKMFDQENSPIPLVENKMNNQSNISLFTKKWVFN